MIQNISLTDFRNFKKKNIDFSDKVTIIVGRNGIGKTNILESLFLLSTGKSFKARRESEMLAYDHELARISGNVASSTKQVAGEDKKHATNNLLHTTKLEVILTDSSNGWPKKRLLVNGVPRRMIDFAGNFKTVLFGPWDMDLVTESPSIRRNFLDIVLSQTDREYRRCIGSYEKGLRQRNKLLWRIREEGVSRSQLLFWNQLLIKNGNYITEQREKFIDFVNNTKGLQSMVYSLQYDRSVISEGRLEQYAREEVASATTLVGPHRDDFVFEIRNSKLEIRNLAAYGSRGEQRMGVLWLKMAELNYIEQEILKTDPEKNLGLTSRPTLLLDDIFSELDHNHREIVMDVIAGQQTIITTADEHFLEGLEDKKNIVINL